MSQPLPTRDDVLAASDRLRGRIVRTPTLRNALLDELAGGPVLVKAECLQRTGSFKLRGATNAIGRLAPERLLAGIVAYSSGNHAQAIACAAAAAGAPATIVMPADAPAVKRDATRRWGAEIVAYDRAGESREAIAAEIVARTGGTLIPPYEHPDVIAGQGTLALEMAEDAEAESLALNALLVCTGGGGLTAGCGLALEHTDIYAVEPADFDDTGRSLAAGTRVGNTPGGSMLCDALLTPMPGELTFALNSRRLSGAFAVTDAEVLAAMAFAFTHLKVVVEPGGAVALAAVLSGRIDASSGPLGVVLSGGNVDAPVFARALQHA